MRNERGYIFFSTLIVLSFVIFVMVNSIHLYVTEKNFADKSKSIYIIDHLLFLAKADAVMVLQQEESANNGVFIYDYGSVVYDIAAFDAEQVKVSLYAHEESAEKSKGMGSAYFIYHLTENKITKWSEV